MGANAWVVRPEDPARGRWRLGGEKWFCSNVGADLYAVSARPEGAPEGTPGLGLFVVPRRLDDGRPNGSHIRRLKSKRGTRTLPTAEVDFDDAIAWTTRSGPSSATDRDSMARLRANRRRLLSTQPGRKG